MKTYNVKRRKSCKTYQIDSHNKTILMKKIDDKNLLATLKKFINLKYENLKLKKKNSIFKIFKKNYQM